MRERSGFEYWRRYQLPATGDVMHPGLNSLTDLIIRPGIEKRFYPLLAYRGNVTAGSAHRLWNFALMMMAAEAETLSDGIKLSNNPAFSQLCGPVRTPTKMAMRSFLNFTTVHIGIGQMKWRTKMAKIDQAALDAWKPDFSPDECERRMDEAIRRACGKPPTFNLTTGQPCEGDQLTPAELRRRGYDT